MRLHRLTLSAFGPFAETEEVDFDALAEGGLFLFTGPTGAGKTSVLDGICFALYGDVPGGRHGRRTLRSDHATPETRCEVSLELTIRGRRLLVTRSPAWDRPKRRGSGTTTEPARVVLQERLEGVWQPLSTRLDEAGHLIGGLLGLSLSQFCQVVLLPQGQFADFLRADADRRAELLEHLFDSQRFAAVESWLVERRRESWRALEEADQQVARLRARLSEAAGIEEEITEIAAEDTSAWAEGLVTAAQTTRLGAVAAEKQAMSARDEARQAAEAARALDQAREGHARLVQERMALQARVDDRAEAGRLLEVSRRAAPVLPLVQQLVMLRDSAKAAELSIESLPSEAVRALASTGTDGTTVPVVRQRVAELRSELVRLDLVLADEAEAGRLGREAADLEREVVALDAQSAGVSDWIDRAQGRRSLLQAARDAARDATAALPKAREDAELTDGRLLAGRARDRLEAQCVGLATSLRSAVDESQTARQEWLDVRQRRLDGMAAELATGLEDGVGCPVCGSEVHPTPAPSASGAVTEDEERSAERRAAAAEKRRLDCEQLLRAAEVELAAARAAAGGNADAADLAQAAERAEAHVEVLAAAAAELPVTEQAIEAFDVEHERQTREQVRLAEQAHGLRAAIRAHRERVDRLQAAVDLARGDDPTVRARAERLSRLAEDGERLAAAMDAAARVQDELLRAEARVAAASEKAGFDTPADVASAALDEDSRKELEELCREYDAEVSAVDKRLAEADMAAFEADTAQLPDLGAAEAEAAAREAHHATAVGARTSAEQCCRSLTRLSGELESLWRRRAPLAEHHRTVDRLSRLAEGKSTDNSIRMSLSAYVLAARLEQVAEAATGRLLAMSSGRFSLVHSVEPGKGRGRGGLLLRVVDSWTGAERDPATLSGGEGFAASLALALGLADVVTAEAGGSLLETLFVDEGFGSLDEDTLEEVMTALDGLRSGGRVVGIVSHVADLRQRIPVQLKVTKRRTGSSISQ